MKKIYFSTFLQGLERPVDAMLHKEGGVAVERILNGAAQYRSVREPNFPYLHQTFRILYQMKPVSDVNEAVRKLLSSGEWLDRFPYEEIREGQRFRVITSSGDKLVAANMRFVAMLEERICSETGLRVGREKPDIELWILCRPEAAYFLWRVGRRATTSQDGQLRSDVCAVISFLAHCGGSSAAILGGSGTSLATALRAGGTRTLTLVSPDAKNLSGKLPGVRVIAGQPGYTDLPDAGQAAVLIPMNIKEKKTEETEARLRGTLFEAKRIVSPDGMILLIGTHDQADATLRKAQGVRNLGHYDFTMSGLKCAVWMLRPQSDSEEAIEA